MFGVFGLYGVSESSNLLEFTDITIAQLPHCCHHHHHHPPFSVTSTVGFRPRGKGPVHARLADTLLTPGRPSDCSDCPALPCPACLIDGPRGRRYTLSLILHTTPQSEWLDTPSALFSPGSHVPTGLLGIFLPQCATSRISRPRQRAPPTDHRPQTSLSSYSRDLSNANVGWRPR